MCISVWMLQWRSQNISTVWRPGLLVLVKGICHPQPDNCSKIAPEALAPTSMVIFTGNVSICCKLHIIAVVVGNTWSQHQFQRSIIMVSLHRVYACCLQALKHSPPSTPHGVYGVAWPTNAGNKQVEAEVRQYCSQMTAVSWARITRVTGRVSRGQRTHNSSFQTPRRFHAINTQ